MLFSWCKLVKNSVWIIFGLEKEEREKLFHFDDLLLFIEKPWKD